MLRKIILENFMSHGRTEIDLAPGLTVLTGPNNCGKSAVVAALQTLATNGRTTHVTRHGQQVCRITVETDDDHTIVWERNKNTVKYNLDGEDIHRVGTSIPDSLHDLLRLDRVHADLGKTTHEYDIHFGQQKSPVFLLDETGSRAASFFASSSDAARLVEMQHVHRANLRDRKAAARRLSAEQRQNASELQTYSQLDAVAERVAVAEASKREIEAENRRIARITELTASLVQATGLCAQLSLRQNTLARLDQTETSPVALERDRNRVDQLTRIVDQFRRLSRSQRRLEQSRCLLEPLVQPPQLFEVDRVGETIAQVAAAQQHKQTTRRVLDQYNRLTNPPTLQPADQCRKLLRNMIFESNREQTASRANDILRELRQPSRIESVAELKAMIVQLLAKSRRLRRTTRARRVFDELAPQPRIVDAQPLAQLLNRLRQSIDSEQQSRNAAAAAKDQLSQCEREIRQHVAAHPTCQTCGGRIDPETLMSAAPDVHLHATDGAADE